MGYSCEKEDFHLSLESCWIIEMDILPLHCDAPLSPSVLILEVSFLFQGAWDQITGNWQGLLSKKCFVLYILIV